MISAFKMRVLINFVHLVFKGLHTICGAGDPRSRHGVAVHVYCCDVSMKDK